MSYEKMMKWNKNHRKGTRQTVIMHTTEKPTFTPSITFLEKYFKYRAKEENEGREPMECEQYYKIGLR